MAGINRTNSPMNMYRDDYLETKEEIDKARDTIIDEQNQKPSFLVGSIERVNERIANLGKELEMFASSLVIESQASNLEEDYLYPSIDDNYGRVKAFIADQESKEKYLLKRIQNTKKKKETKATKPKLVELFQFQGFDDKNLTPLPEVDSALTIIQRVTAAQTGLERKPHYKEEFTRLFHSKMSEAVLVDSFWWFFLNRYHPNKTVQPKFFNRIAHNYVKLLLVARHPKYRDVFFQTYADLLAQGMYASFCAAFPDSWRQFQGDFISSICELTGLWVVGTKPAPDSWKKWNFEKLEPIDLRKEEILKKDSKKGNILNLEVSATDISHTDVNSSLAPSEQDLSLMNSKMDRKPRVPSLTSNKSSMRQDKDSESALIETVAHAQTSGERVEKQKIVKGTNLQPIQENQIDYADSFISKSSSSSSRYPKSNKRRQSSKVPRPVGVAQRKGSSVDKSILYQEHLKSTCEEENNQLLIPKNSSSHVGIVEESNHRKIKKSHPIASGPSFTKCVFNVGGQSPLVKHFLRKKGLEKKAGAEVLLQRTEIGHIPSSDSQTYQDVIHDSFQFIRHLDEDYQRLYEDGIKEHTNFIKMQKHVLKEHMRRENSLMSQPREVKRLSDLLVLELLKDPDEVNTGAAQAVEESLLQQDQDSS